MRRFTELPVISILETRNEFKISPPLHTDQNKRIAVEIQGLKMEIEGPSPTENMICLTLSNENIFNLNRLNTSITPIVCEIISKKSDSFILVAKSNYHFFIRGGFLNSFQLQATSDIFHENQIKDFQYSIIFHDEV